MVRQRRLTLLHREMVQPEEIMVPIALHVRDAEQRHQGEGERASILLALVQRQLGREVAHPIGAPLPAVLAHGLRGVLWPSCWPAKRPGLAASRRPRWRRRLPILTMAQERWR